MSTTTVVHALTCTACGSHDVRPTVRAWANCTDCKHGMALGEAMTCGCDGYDCVVFPADDSAPYTPAPGTEYPFSVSDIARATAHLLGSEWGAESGFFGVTGTVFGPFTSSFTLLVDYEGDLCIAYDRFVCDGFPEHPELPKHIREYDDGVYLEASSASEGLETLAERCAAAIRACVGP
ncbi:hypothetical protein ACIP93_33655 [Streptomyces sp. NPDC088745]|uniref:hypothetical protein n=1 Tax=Streptomyces sp. NPDC088745 TaxID=3365884 RepID=UPI0038152154